MDVEAEVVEIERMYDEIKEDVEMNTSETVVGLGKAQGPEEQSPAAAAGEGTEAGSRGCSRWECMSIAAVSTKIMFTARCTRGRAPRFSGPRLLP